MQTVPYIDQPCDRCGSKKRISRTWKEKLVTFSGTSMLEMAQVVCTNKVCQKAFDEKLAQDKEISNLRKQKKEEQDKIRKENMVRTVALRKKNKAS